MILDTKGRPSLEAAAGLAPLRYTGDEPAGERVLVSSIHDGDKIPCDLLGGGGGALLQHREVQRCYRRERDWGANLIAAQLARHLGLGGFLKVELARAFLDHNRLPGDSPPGAPYLLRKSIFSPVSDLISRRERDRVLRRCYDRFDHEIARRLEGRLLSVAVHTYDPIEWDGSLRPQLSLITGQRQRCWRSLTAAAGDPLLPADLLDCACDPRLTRLAKRALEGTGRPVTLDRPYDLHPGAVDWRIQAKLFFRYLERRFGDAFPGTAGRASYRGVWRMLTDVPRRSAEARELHGFLHGRRPAPAGRRRQLADCRRAYREVECFLALRRRELLPGYRFADERPSTLGIEVRKDLICELDEDGAVVGLRADAEATADQIAAALAAAIAAYGAHVARPAAEPRPSQRTSAEPPAPPPAVAA